MTRRFMINVFGPNDEFLQLYKEPRLDAETEDFRAGHFVKVPADGETEDWIHVENYFDRFDNDPLVRWVPSWAVGDPIEDEAETITARSLTFGAVRNEVDVPEGETRTVSAEYLVALFLIENGLAGSVGVPAADTEFTVRDDRPNTDAIGGYGITTEEWAEFTATDAAEPGWKKNDFIRGLTLTQMFCVRYLTMRDWNKFSVLNGGSAANPFLPRKLDLLMCRLIGPAAAADVARREREKDALNTKMDRVVREANGWLAGSTPEKNLLRDRAEFLTTDGNAITVKTFIERCRETLDAALKDGDACVKTYVPGFQVTPADGEWMKAARAELKLWSDGGWKEHVNPGKAQALGYFDHTDHGPGKVTNQTTGEITHWCGAFVAHCMDAAGAPVPRGAAASANWAKWGDVSLPTAPGSDIPEGAVVTLAGSAQSNRISHVTLFVKWDGDTHFIGLGGNQSDAVTEARQVAENIVAIRGMASKTEASGDDEDILARTLYGEIRGGTDQQIRNVADVVLTRFLTGYRSGGSIAGTCQERKQFSCWNLGTDARSLLLSLPGADQAGYDRLLVIAKDVIGKRLGGAAPGEASLAGVRHYYAPAAMKPAGSVPDWATGKTAVHKDGKHFFFRGIA